MSGTSLKPCGYWSRICKLAHLQIPWVQVVGRRSKLVHEYWGTAWTLIEAIVDEDLPNWSLFLPTNCNPKRGGQG